MPRYAAVPSTTIIAAVSLTAITWLVVSLNTGQNILFSLTPTVIVLLYCHLFSRDMQSRDMRTLASVLSSALGCVPGDLDGHIDLTSQ